MIEYPTPYDKLARVHGLCEAIYEALAVERAMPPVPDPEVVRLRAEVDYWRSVADREACWHVAAEFLRSSLELKNDNLIARALEQMGKVEARPPVELPSHLAAVGVGEPK